MKCPEILYYCGVDESQLTLSAETDSIFMLRNPQTPNWNGFEKARKELFENIPALC